MRNVEKLKDRIAAAFTSTTEEPTVARDIAFHMTDWADDVDAIVRLYEQAETLKDEEIRNVVIGVLAHVPNHIAAAKKLIGLGPIEDVFGVGVLQEDDE